MAARDHLVVERCNDRVAFAREHDVAYAGADVDPLGFPVPPTRRRRIPLLTAAQARTTFPHCHVPAHPPVHPSVIRPPVAAAADHHVSRPPTLLQARATCPTP